MSSGRFRFLIEGLILLAVLLMQGQLSRWLRDLAWFRPFRLRRLVLWAVCALIGLWLCATLISSNPRAMIWSVRWPWLQWNLALAICWAMFICGAFPLAFLLRRLPPFDPARRKLLRVAHAAAVAAPLGLIGFGIVVSRRQFELNEVAITIPGLAKDLDGLRLAQVTDIHLGPFLSRSELARVVGMVNETRPHVALVTGDLITIKGDPLDDCLRVLAGLRAEAGILGCMGNHENYAGALNRATTEGARLGIEFLRGRSRQLSFGSATLNIAGVDYLPGSEPRLSNGSALTARGATNILLSHNPNIFPAAARAGFDLTISGHTHGGQITMEILSESVTLVRFLTPYVQGLFRDGAEALYVSRGIGTVGAPVRIGAPPEITLIRLCAT
jgi:hypothetical protein